MKPSYKQIRSQDCLKDALRGMTLVEHPTVYCVPEKNMAEFPTCSVSIEEMKSDQTNERKTESPSGLAGALESTGEQQETDVATQD